LLPIEFAGWQRIPKINLDIIIAPIQTVVPGPVTDCETVALQS
jgi:hypothetical protein